MPSPSKIEPIEIGRDSAAASMAREPCAGILAIVRPERRYLSRRRKYPAFFLSRSAQRKNGGGNILPAAARSAKSAI